jgi:hypothetical protein
LTLRLRMGRDPVPSSVGHLRRKYYSYLGFYFS